MAGSSQPAKRLLAAGPPRGTPPAAGGTPRRDVPEEEVIYSTWPLNEQDYPETGSHSFQELSAMADDLGCKVTTRRPDLQP